MANGSDYLDDETEAKRGIFQTQGFWMGKYPVTQEEWKAVMGTNPSYFKPDGGGKAKLEKDGITDTSRFPVESVSWDMICGKDGKGDCFLSRVNKRDGAAKVFGKAGTVCVAPRGRVGVCMSGREGECVGRFSGGTPLNGTEANCDWRPSPVWSRQGNLPGADVCGRWRRGEEVPRSIRGVCCTWRERVAMVRE